ncbi:MAG: N-acetyltransferase [Rhodospirillales bacterium]|jgi:predicted N-acetyltransferase YhbS|nr:N-acetyltransferase [Rhodospirillales bacterium]
MLYEFSSPLPHQHGAIEALLDTSFGVDRLGKTSYRFRQAVGPIAQLGMVAHHGARLVGIIAYWPVEIGEQAVPALLMGPLAVEPSLRGHGIGVTLIRRTLAKAARAGHRTVVLVGDADYYARFGFVAAASRAIRMPGEADRLMVKFLAPEPRGLVEGTVRACKPARRNVDAA